MQKLQKWWEVVISRLSLLNQELNSNISPTKAAKQGRN